MEEHTATHVGPDGKVWHLRGRGEISLAMRCPDIGDGFCPAGVDGYCIGGWGDPDNPNCHG